MRTRLSMCSGYGWGIDLDFVSIAGWWAMAVLVGGMSQLHGKSILAGFRLGVGEGCRSCVHCFFFVRAAFLNIPCPCLLSPVAIAAFLYYRIQWRVSGRYTGPFVRAVRSGEGAKTG